MRAFEWCIPCVMDLKIHWDTLKMAAHPTGVIINIPCIKRGDQGCSCKEHKICSSVFSANIVVHLQKMSVVFFLMSMIIICLCLFHLLDSHWIEWHSHWWCWCLQCCGECCHFEWALAHCLILSSPLMPLGWEGLWIAYGLDHYSCSDSSPCAISITSHLPMSSLFYTP